MTEQWTVGSTHPHPEALGELVAPRCAHCGSCRFVYLATDGSPAEREGGR
jgi:hypothetical protein